MRDIYVINPVAGKKLDIERICNEINRCYQNSGLNFEIYITKAPNDATTFVRSRCQASNEKMRFFACGGDGTLNEVVNGVVGFKNVSVGVVPFGSGNDFIKNFTPNGSFLNLKDQLYGEETKIDLICVNNRYGVNLCNVGFDANVAHNMTRFKKIPFVKGPLAYTFSIFYCLLHSVKNKLIITMDNHQTANDYLLAVAANGICYGGHYKAAPLAKINDGYIDFCAVNAISRFQFLKFLKYYKAGMHLQHDKIKKQITYQKCKQITIESHKKFTVCVDGETYQTNQVSITVQPAAISFVVPTAKSVLLTS